MKKIVLFFLFLCGFISTYASAQYRMVPPNVTQYSVPPIVTHYVVPPNVAQYSVPPIRHHHFHGTPNYGEQVYFGNFPQYTSDQYYYPQPRLVRVCNQVLFQTEYGLVRGQDRCQFITVY